MLDCKYVFQDSDLKDNDEPCLCLYWQLGFNYHYQETPSSVATRRSKLRSLNLSFGLTHYTIDHNIKEILDDILTSHISPLDFELVVDNNEGDTHYENE